MLKNLGIEQDAAPGLSQWEEYQSEQGFPYWFVPCVSKFTCSGTIQLMERRLGKIRTHRPRSLKLFISLYNIGSERIQAATLTSIVALHFDNLFVCTHCECENIDAKITA
jgi:hypothetical protein